MTTEGQKRDSIVERAVYSETGAVKSEGNDGPESANVEESWFCLRTKPRREEFARTHLERQGIESFLPKIKQKRLRGTEIRWKVVPLFSRYLFFKHPTAASFRSIEATRGVSGIVSFGGAAASVPLAIIDEIRRRCVDDVVELAEADFKKGESVQILAGPYEGMEAVFDRQTSDRDRVVVLLDTMASVARVTINRNLLDAT